MGGSWKIDSPAHTNIQLTRQLPTPSSPTNPTPTMCNASPSAGTVVRVWVPFEPPKETLSSAASFEDPGRHPCIELSEHKDTRIPSDHPQTHTRARENVPPAAFQIQHFRYRIFDTQFAIQHTRCNIPDTTFPIQHCWYGIFDATFPIQKSRYSIVGTAFSIQRSRYSILATAFSDTLPSILHSRKK